MEFLCTFRKTWWRRILKTFKKEQISCRRGVFEKIKEIGVEKMHQILTEVDKNTRKMKFGKFYAVFVYFLKHWWLRRRSTRNKLVVRKAFFRKETKFCNEKKRTICDQK